MGCTATGTLLTPPPPKAALTGEVGHRGQHNVVQERQVVIAGELALVTRLQTQQAKQQQQQCGGRLAADSGPMILCDVMPGVNSEHI